jgi:antitoxin component YwqK of YwqJK toxin-antitoxin module
MRFGKKIITLILIQSFSALVSQTKQEFWPNGNLKSKESPDGQWEKYYENGKLESKNSFVDDDWLEKTAYFSNGQLEYKKYEHRKSRKFRGNEIIYFENGKVSEKILCDTNHQVASMVHYYENGQLKDSSDSNTGYFCDFYSDGKKQSRYTYKCKSSNGPCKHEGLYLTYYDNGQPKDSLSFENGCPIGTHLTFYKNGNLKEYQTYLFAENYNCSDFMRGLDLVFDYRHNNKPPRTGEYHYNWPNNKTREEGEFKDGRKIGFWYFAFSDAEISAYIMENYNNESKKNGEQERWDVDAGGKLYKSKIELYENGRLKEETDYDSNGKITKKVTY